MSHIRQALSLLLDSTQFRDTTRMKRFLSYIVDETLAGRGSRLKGYSIGLEVFDRPEDFDPQADTIVRVQAGQLRRRLDLYYSEEGRDSPLRITVPKGSYVPRFEFRTQADEPTDAPEPPDSETRFATQANGKPANRPGVIVLTMTDLSLNGDRDFFAEGLTAEIVNALVQFRYLRVVTRTASVTASGPEVGVQKLAEQHDVEFILTGSVRHAGENVRVSVNLISARNGLHIYSKVFDRRYTARNMFDIQDEIASYVAASVAAPYGAITRYHRRLMPDMEPSAYEVILRFYEMNLSPSRHKAARIRDDIEKVIAANPDYSIPWAMHSLMDSFHVGQTLDSENAHKYLRDSMKSAVKATRLNNDNSLGFLALLLANYFNGKFDDYERAAERCVALNPNDATALVYLAATQAFQGHLKDAHALHERALMLLPRPPRWFSFIPAVEALLAGQYQYVLNAVGTVAVSRGIWSQMLTLAALGHLRRVQVCRQLLEELRKANPRYDEELHAAFLRWHPHKALRDVTYGGWEKAGLTL